MTSSLVGSEMCIRDSSMPVSPFDADACRRSAPAMAAYAGVLAIIEHAPSTKVAATLVAAAYR
eukprot:4270224-Prorocentrum_lima.AAC.1